MCLAGNHVELLFASELDEAHGVARNADREVLVFFLLRMFHSVLELFDTEYVHVQVVAALAEVTVENLHELVGTFFVVMAECIRVDGLRVADTVESVFVRNLGDRVEGCQEAVLFGTVARACTRRERFTLLTTIRECARGLTVNNVTRDGKDGSGRFRVTVSRRLLDLGHERLEEPNGDIVCAVVVVSITREVAFDLEVLSEAGSRIADDLDLGVLDCRKGVDNVAEACDTRCKRTANVGIDESHFGSFVVVLVVHVVDQVERVHVQVSEPIHVEFKLVDDFIVVEVFASDRRIFRANLRTLHEAFILTAVDGVEERLGEVCTSAEELHFLTGLSCRNAAADAVVVAPDRAHRVIVFVLDGAGLHGDFCSELLEACREAGTVEDCEVRFRSRSHVHERVQEAVVVLGHLMATVLAEASDFERSPHRVTAEEFVVACDTGELDHAKLHHEMVDDFLSFGFVDDAVLQVTGHVNIDECRNAANAHGGTVLRLDGSEVTEVEPLHGFACVRCRLGNVVAVNLGHDLHAFESLDLFGEFFAFADHVFAHIRFIGQSLVGLLLGDEVIDTVKGNAAVVTDDTATAVSIRKTRNDVGLAGHTHCRRVGVENALVVSLVEFSKDAVKFFARRVTVVLARFFSHLDATERHECALERLVGLETYDLFEILSFFGNVASIVACKSGDDVCVHVEDAALCNFSLL